MNLSHFVQVGLLALAIVASTASVGQVAQFPQVYYNSQGSGGFNLNVRSSANSSGSVLTSVAVNGRIGAESQTTNSGDAFYNWIRVCLPQTSSTDNNPDYGYMAVSEFYMRIHESATSTNHATVNTASTPLGVRTTAGGTTYVTISGSNAYYGAGSIVARTGSTSSVSGSTWYQIHLPNNCSQATGWVNGLYLTIPAAPNFRVVGGRICDDAGSCAFLGNINGALISFSGGNGSTRSSSGFYQYKLTTSVTTTITCTASGFSTSTPTSYNHTASSHNYTRQFVMSNVSCSYSLSPNSNNSVPNGGGSYSVSVTAPASCAWTATESLSWVSITSGASGTGNGTVNYTVTSNGGSSRSGTMTIGGQSFQITQAGACAYSLNPTENLTVPVGGGGYSVAVSTQTGCAWTATESLSWVSITSGSSGTGSGTVSYTVTNNGGSSRSGTITISGQSFQITQAGVCSYSLSPTSNLSIPVGGGTYSVDVNTQAGCAWTASESLSWLSIISGSSGTDDGTVNYSVNTNVGSARTGSLTIAGQSFQVTQAGAAPITYSVSAAIAPNSGGASITPLLAPYKVCADGSTATTITITATGGTPDMSSIKLRVQGNPADEAQYGGFDNSYAYGTNTKSNQYQHPEYLPNALSPHRQIIIEAYDEVSTLILASISIRIYRAPVTFVHGLWGNMDAFQDMDNDWIADFGYSNLVTYRADYVTSHARSFEHNASEVPDAVSATLALGRYRQFSCGKVDVVAHSMGGDLTRLYLQSEDYGHDIHTITTINTPHSGTQAANLLLSPLGAETAAAMLLFPAIPGVPGYPMSAFGGAVGDLRTTSSYMENNLNGNAVVVPSLNYNSTSTNPAASRDWLPIKITFYSHLSFFLQRGVFSPLDLAEQLYSPDGFDPIVPTTSQIAGMSTVSQSEVTHTEAEKQPFVITSLQNYLGLNPDAFNQNGFQHEELDMPWWFYTYSPAPGLAPQMSDSLYIIEPAIMDTFSVADTLSVLATTATSDSMYFYCELSNNGRVILATDTFATGLELNYVITPDVHGTVHVAVIGIKDELPVLCDSVDVFVQLVASLDSIRFTYEWLSLPLGNTIKPKVLGYFSDQQIRDVSHWPGLSFEALSTGVVQILATGLTGTSEGLTGLVATCLGHSDTTTVNVYTGSEMFEAAFQASSNVLCGGGSVSFVDQSGGTPVTLSWHFPGGVPSTSTSVNPTVTYPNLGAFDVMLVTTWTDKVDTFSVTGYVRVGSLPTVAIEADGPTTVFEGDSVTLNAVGSGAVTDYHWMDIGASSSITVTVSGEYRVTAVDSLGCIAQAIENVVVNPLVRISARAFLDGPYAPADQAMHDSLRTRGLIPATEPYTGLGYTHVGGGGETVTPAALEVTGSNAVVDWVVLELRSGSNPSQVLQTLSGLIQRDGDIVGKDGVSPLGFSLPEGSYYVAIRHRNHLGAMTSGAVFLSSTTSVVDFTNASTSTYGTEARKTSGNHMTLWSGNTLWDNELKYTGSNNDRDPILVRIGGTVPTNTIPGYYRDDVNLDGVVKYTGSGNDRDPILVNIGGTVPTQVRTEQLP